MSEKSEFTVNVKVNGLEDVEALRKAIEGIFDHVHTHHPGPGENRYDVRVDSRADNAFGKAPDIHPRFSIGDVVSLVSGGPAMTVSAIDADGEVSCVWFTPEDERRSAMFQPDCLEF